uniref:Uncharacterized protein n=1 Tax=Arundo donax TaxID=35708 RepID=A0A0A9H5M8_ARUDO
MREGFLLHRICDVKPMQHIISCTSGTGTSQQDINFHHDDLTSTYQLMKFKKSLISIRYSKMSFFL